MSESHTTQTNKTQINPNTWTQASKAEDFKSKQTHSNNRKKIGQMLTSGNERGVCVFVPPRIWGAQWWRKRGAVTCGTSPWRGGCKWTSSHTWDCFLPLFPLSHTLICKHVHTHTLSLSMSLWTPLPPAPTWLIEALKLLISKEPNVINVHVTLQGNRKGYLFICLLLDIWALK